LITLLIAIITVFIFLILKKKCFTLILDNVEQQDICLGGFSSYSISQNLSGELGVIKKSLLGDLKFTYSKNTNSPGVTTKLIDDVPVEIQYEDDGFRTNSVSLMIRKTEKGSDPVVSGTGESGIY
jgi:ubiquitin